MKKKILIILSLILIIVAVIGTMYLIDRNRMKNNEPVIFSTWGYSYSPSLVINYEENNEQDKQKTDEKFELTFHERKDLGIKKIVSKKENGFDIYSFAGDVTIRVGSKEYDLREAILNHIIRMEEIIQKAEKDSNIGKEIQCLVSGGSNNVYRYKNYIIMDYTPADGDRAVYIGVPYMKLNDVI